MKMFEIADEKQPLKALNAKIVRHLEKVRDSGVRDTERIYKGSYREC